MNIFYQTYINLFIAIFLGLFVDKFFQKLHLNHKILRIFLQFTVNIYIILKINFYYRKLHFDYVQHGLFFVSVFLAVQQNLFNIIQKLDFS